MVKMRSAERIAEKWARVTPERVADYEEGVKNPKKDWAEETKKAEAAYADGIAAAIRDKRFGKGVAKAGTEKWRKGAVTKGVERFGPGVAAGAENYKTGYAPYREVVEHLTLPPRFAKGDPRNYERSKVVGMAQHNKKIGK